jgi:glycerol kinase
VHATDVTNASRTMMMSLYTLDWDEELLSTFQIPRKMLPEIRPSSGLFGRVSASAVPEVDLEGVRIGGVLGDQQAALFGQTCFGVGEAKCTYGTGCFVLMNTGNTVVQSGEGGTMP